MKHCLGRLKLRLSIAWVGILLAGCLGIGAIGNVVVTRKVQAQLDGLLIENGLQDKISWQRLKVNLLGVLTAHNVHIRISGAELSIQEVQIRDFVDDKQRMRFQVNARGLAWSENFVKAWLGDDFEGAWASMAVAPMNVDFFWDANWENNELHVRAALEKTDLAKASAALNMENINNFKAYWGSALAVPSASAKKAEGMWRSPGFWLSLAQVRLQSLILTTEDLGGVKHLDLADQRDFLCQSFAWRQLLQNSAAACTLAMHFATGKQKRIQLEALPAKPMPLGHFYSVVRGQYSERLRKDLNAQLHP